MTQGVGPEFKPQYHQKKKKKNVLTTQGNTDKYNQALKIPTSV
jgi:hypothetical protein